MTISSKIIPFTIICVCREGKEWCRGRRGRLERSCFESDYFFIFFSVFCAICFVVSNGVAASPGLTPYLITVFTPVADASSLWAAAWTLQSALTQSALQTTAVVQQAQVVVSSLSTTSQCPCLTTLAPSVTVAFSLL